MENIKSGNFRVTKLSCFNISCKNFFVVGATHEIFFTVRRFKSVRLIPMFTDQKQALESGLTRQEGMEDDTVKRACCVHSYHVYKEIWEAAVGEIL